VALLGWVAEAFVPVGFESLLMLRFLQHILPSEKLELELEFEGFETNANSSLRSELVLVVFEVSHHVLSLVDDELSFPHLILSRRRLRESYQCMLG